MGKLLASFLRLPIDAQERMFDRLIAAQDRVSELERQLAAAQTTAQQVDECGFVAVRRDAIEWLKMHYPALCEKSGLCERIGGRLYTITRLSALQAGKERR
jgi:hypothetical protein